MTKRVIIALATEAEDDFIWSQLENLTAMYSAGPLAVKFAYFGEEGSRASRPLMSTRWASDPEDWCALLDHAHEHCVCGCYVQTADVLGEALKEAKDPAGLQAVVIFGDRFSGNRDEALEHAWQLHAVGTRIFVFQESANKSAGDSALKALADAGGGTLITYNPNVEKLASRLPVFFKAIGHYALGGPDALEALEDQSARLLLEQIGRSR